MTLQSVATAAQSSGMRGHILDTALRLFTGNGYFNTSIHDIRREAGISIGSIYNHFGGKEGIAKALYHDLLEQMDALVESVIRDGDSAYTRGRGIVARLFELTERDPVSMRFILNAKHREFLPDEPPICSAKPFVKLRDIVNHGILSGEIRDMDPWIAAACAFGPALRLITLRLDGVIPDSLDVCSDEVWDNAWLALQAPGPALKLCEPTSSLSA